MFSVPPSHSLFVNITLISSLPTCLSRSLTKHENISKNLQFLSSLHCDPWLMEEMQNMRTHTRAPLEFIFFPNTKMALYIFFSVFFLELAEKLLFLISMTTSKQGSGLDTAWLSSLQRATHTCTRTNYSLTKPSCGRQGKRKLLCCSGCCCCSCLWCFSLCLADLPSLHLCLYPSYNWLMIWWGWRCLLERVWGMFMHMCRRMYVCEQMQNGINIWVFVCECVRVCACVSVCVC